MSFTSLRRVAFASSSLSSCRLLNGIRFANTVSNLSAFEKRADGDRVKGLDTTKLVSSQRLVEHSVDPSEQTLVPSKTESYLLSLLTDGVTPTLHDLERLKPPEHSHPRSREYALEYSALLDNICRSFSNDQLRIFTQQYGLQLGSKRRKISYAEAIVEKAWQWPSLRELKRAQRDRTEVASQTLALTPSELFILLGQDGSNLFQLSRKYNIHVSVKPNPLAVYLEGSRESVREAKTYIDGVRKDIVEDTLDTPLEHPVSQEVLQRISRLSGAFVENAENQKLRIRAKNTTNIMLAQRLAIRVNYQIEPSELLAQHVYDQELRTPTAAPLAYSLYPFSLPRSVPPMMKSNAFFRWRRVGDWLGDNLSRSLDVSRLTHSHGKIFSMDGDEINLQHRLSGKTFMADNRSRRIISALSGHILFSPPRVDTQPSLRPPHTGELTYSDTCSWIAAQRSLAMYFPSLPIELVKALPSRQRVLHRLIYRCLPALGQDSKDSITTPFIQLEIPLVDPKQVRLPMDIPGGGVFASAMFCSGSSANIDLLMPDRHMDLRFNISDMDPLTAGRQPSELLNYLNNLENYLTSNDSDVTQPAPPLRVFHDDCEYVLATNASVRQSTESPSWDSSPETVVTSESILDLETGHYSAVCVISSGILHSPQGWDAFLQKCDWMTAMASPRNSKLL